MHEPEADASQWGFFNIDNLFSRNYHGDSSQHDVGIDHGQFYFKEYSFPAMNTDNDELLAHLIQQEELHQLAITQSPDLAHSEEEYLRNSYAVPKWHNSSNAYYLSQEPCLHEPDDAGSFWSSPGNRSSDADDHSLDVTDETELDGEFGKRLHQMNPVPHVPKINGDIPSADEATSDYQRLLHRLQLYNLIEHRVQGDGNCQFRALSDQFYRITDHHEFVREQVVQQLKAHPEMYNMYVPMDFAEYLDKMSKNGEWGDHVTLKAAADSYGVRIIVVTSFKDTCYIEILPIHQKSKRVICLSFWAEVHYNSIYPREEVPPSTSSDFKRKRRWWDFSQKAEKNNE